MPKGVRFNSMLRLEREREREISLCPLGVGGNKKVPFGQVEGRHHVVLKKSTTSILEQPVPRIGEGFVDLSRHS